MADRSGRRGCQGFWLSTLPADTPLEDRVQHVKGRYRVEQDYRELKQEVGLAKFEAGAASITMSPCVWRLTASSCASEAFSPLRAPPKPTRMARHNPYSIASLRHRSARMIMRKLDRCPYCDQPHRASQMADNRPFHKML